MANFTDPKNRDALIQGLLGFGGGILSGNYGRYGQLSPALGQGIQGFSQGYYGAKQQEEENRRRQELLDLQQGQFGMQKQQFEFQQQQMREQQEARKRLFGGISPQPVQTQQPITRQDPSGALVRPMMPDQPMDVRPIGPDDFTAPEVGVQGKKMEDPAVYRSMAMQAAAAGLTQEATFLNGLATQLESQQEKEQNRNEKTFTDNQGIVRYFNTGEPVAKQKPKAPEGMQYDDAGQLISIPGYLDMKKQIAQAGATKVSQTMGSGPNLTPGQEALDKKFADEYNAWAASGGYADIVKQLDQLREVSRDLTKKNLTGPITGNVPDAVRQFTNPESLAARDKVEEVVQRNLRLILGAQFAEKEGERLIARAFNPKLDETENKQRVDRLISQIQSAAQAKQDAAEYFERNGTLQGWKGKTPRLEDFDPEREEKKPANTGLMKGQVVDGYKYKGGDPALESSWEKQ